MIHSHINPYGSFRLDLNARLPLPAPAMTTSQFIVPRCFWLGGSAAVRMRPHTGER
jgi:hypothetical protein